LGGFIATRDEEKFVMEYPSRLFGIAKTAVAGEWGFGDVAYDRTSFGVREKGKEFVGTAAALWGITAGVYLALMGPRGMFAVGQTIMQKSQYLAKCLQPIPGIRVPRLAAPFFKELVVDFNGSGLTVKQINRFLLKKKIFGGKDLSQEFPELGQSALYCVTEMLSLQDIESLVNALQNCLATRKTKKQAGKK
jgi:glycine dehydrogenase subunit 1